jgi:A/G-specific adenine glycosylase
MVIVTTMAGLTKISKNHSQKMSKTSADPKLHFEATEFTTHVFDWYDRHQRALPWRQIRHKGEGDLQNPYFVWLSEVMLQQTVVATVIPYFLKFIAKWPNIHDLAAAPNEEIMTAWAGLGYYARARNLHKCAKIVSNEHDGVFPQTLVELKKLPGIGEYTAAAILSIAFDKPATVVDGNFERVFSRIFAIETPLPKSKKDIYDLAEKIAFSPMSRHGCYAQAIMDIGATICLPKQPKCVLCPLKQFCNGYKRGDPEVFPYKEKKAAKPKRIGRIYLIENEKNEVLMEKRPDKGLLGGMYGFPTSQWITSLSPLSTEIQPQNTELAHTSLVSTPIKNAKIHHSFTHFDLELEGYSAKLDASLFTKGKHFAWVQKADIIKLGLPTVFKKFAKLVLIYEH